METKSFKMYGGRFVLVMALLLGVLLLAACAEKRTADTKTNDNQAQKITEGESLVIPVSDITETAQFYPVNVNGTEMEVIAVKDSSGQIRTAFNTCQICYDSGRGYYKWEGNVLVCLNCGNRYTADQIEVDVGGCNPWPIFSTDKTVTEDSVTISYSFLEESRKIFENWKTGY